MTEHTTAEHTVAKHTTADHSPADQPTSPDEHSASSNERTTPSEERSAPSDMSTLSRLQQITGTFEPAVLEEAIAYLEATGEVSSRDASSEETSAEGASAEGASAEGASAEEGGAFSEEGYGGAGPLHPLSREKALRALRLVLRLAEQWHGQSHSEAAQDIDRHKMYARMDTGERDRLARGLSRSLAAPARDLLVLEALNRDDR